MMIHQPENATAHSRRTVLKWSGGAFSMLAMAGGVLPNFGITPALAADLGSVDIGVINYANASEQLEAAFYVMVIESPYNDMLETEKLASTYIRSHEVEQCEFLKKALGDKAIPGVDVDFSAVDFTKRESVLGTAMVCEDLGVSAYNGAGKLIKNPD